MLAPSKRLLRYLRSIEPVGLAPCTRPFSSSPRILSGHSKWATIKHDKAKNDSAKGKERTVLAREIINAVKHHGGPDPKTNNRLSAAIASAKRAGMQKAIMDAAIMRGLGKSVSGTALETVTLEVVLPPIGLIVEVETESKARALQDLRAIVTRNNAQASPTQFLFEQRGKVVFGAKDGQLDIDSLLDPALEAGAIDLEENPDEPGTVVIWTEPNTVTQVEKLADTLPLERQESDIVYWPKPDTMVDLEESLAEQFNKLHDTLSEYPGVQVIYTNVR